MNHSLSLVTDADLSVELGIKIFFYPDTLIELSMCKLKIRYALILVQGAFLSE